MPKFVIERDIPAVGKLGAEAIQGAAQKSCAVLLQLGPAIQWVHSYRTADKLYCIYIAENEQLIRDHAAQSGFPASKISKVVSIVDPTTSEGC